MEATASTIPLPTILDRFADHTVWLQHTDLVSVRRALGTKVWHMSPEAATALIEEGHATIMRIDADRNLVVAERRA